MARVRVHNFAVSIDGYAAGPMQSAEEPVGTGGMSLHEWVFQTRRGRQMMRRSGPRPARVRGGAMLDGAH